MKIPHVFQPKIDLFSNKKEVPKILKIFGEKRFPGVEHGGDDPLRIARPPSIDAILCFPKGDIRRNGIYVGAEKDPRFLVRASGQKIISTREDLLCLDLESKMGQERL